MPSVIQRQIDRLVREKSGPPVVTCYLKLEPRDRSRGKYLIKLKNRLRAAEQAAAGAPRAEREAILRDLGRVRDYLAAPDRLPATQGVAIFASAGRRLFEAIPLPSVHRSRLTVASVPLVRELAAVEDDIGRLLVAVVDRSSARCYWVTAFGAEAAGPVLEAEDASLEPPTRAGRRVGSRVGERGYHNRIRNAQQRHWEAVAQRLFALDRAEPARAIILLGSGTAAVAVDPFLHPYLAARLIGHGTVAPRTATPAAVHQAALEVRHDWERARERAAVAEMRERLGEGWAVNGVAASLKALSEGKVRTLLVRGDTSLPGFRLAGSGRLLLAGQGGAWRGEGEPEPVADVVDEALEEALRQRVAVNVLYDEEAAKRVDGLAALLRFK